MSEQHSRGIWSKTIGLFVETDDAPATTPVQPTVAAPVAPAATVNGTLTPTPAFDPEILGMFQNAISARKTPYTALLEKSAVLADVIPDESTRTKAAFKMILSEGRTLDSVLQAIDLHIADVSGELLRLKSTSETASKTKVLSLRSAATQSIELRDSNMEKIKRLQEQIETLHNEAAEADRKAVDMTAQANAAEAEIAAVVDRATAAAELVKQDLSNKKTALTNILK